MFFHFIDTNTSALLECELCQSPLRDDWHRPADRRFQLANRSRECAHVFVTFIKGKNENQTYEKRDDSL